MSFITGTQAELLWAMPASVTKNTYTTQAAFTGVVGTNPVCSLPPGFFTNDNPNPIQRVLYLMARGTIGSTSSPTFAVALGFDSTAGTIANSITVMAATTASSTTVPWLFEAWYTCTGFTTSQITLQVNGRFVMEAVATGGAASASSLGVGFSGTISGSTADPRVQQYIELFGTWSASSASNTTTVQQMMLFGMN